MSGFEIPVFPEGNALTVTTTVLIGVWVVAFFNLRFGWTLSGLVVPGYVVPLMMAKPWSAGVILLESVITYLIVVVISERPRFLPHWCSLFGRDRFFALVLVSVLVRAIGDGWMLPWLGQWADERLGISIDYRNDLHSYGLIVVSLIANYFWKPGLCRGLMAMSTGCFATYLITRYALVGLTNFNIGDLQHTYEDIATSLLASPKAYIIVITTAYLASLMNLRYSWEFNGILIPALLGLLWHEPGKIVVTIAESLMLLGVGSQLLKLPIFQKTTMEGARKLLFFFSLCYCQRLALAHLLPLISPKAAVSEFFGFGFLMTTLMAIKAHDKKLTIRLIRGTLQVSFMGAIAGSLIGFALMKLPHSLTFFDSSLVAVDTLIVPQRSDRDLSDLARADKVLLYQMRARDRYQLPVNSELAAFRQCLELVDEFQNTRQPILLDRLSNVAARCNYEVLMVEDRYLYLRERSPARGWGIYVFSLDNPDGLCVEVPAPLDEWSTIESGLLLATTFDAASIGIAGADRQTNTDGSADVLSQHRTMFSEFHRARSRDNVLQVRGHTRSALRRIAKVTGDDDVVDLKTVKSQLWVSRSLPRSLRLRELQELVPGFEMLWQDAPLTNVLRSINAGGFAELRLARHDRRRLLSRLIVNHKNGSMAQPGAISGHLHEWILALKESVAARASGAYQPATVPEMLFFDQEIVTPLLRLISRDDEPTMVDGMLDCKADTRQDLQAIQAAAQALGYDLVLFHDDNRQEVFVVLHEPTPQRCWGMYVFRWYLAEPYIVEVPRPLLERNVFEFGVSLFDRPAASILSIAGAHPRANPDGTADLIRQTNKVNLLNLVRQVMMRETGPRPMLVMQARAIQAPTRADVVMATDSGDASGLEISPLKRDIIDQLTVDGMSTAFVDGSFGTAGYEVSSGLRAATAGWENKEVATLWLSPTVRMSYRDHTQNRSLAAQCLACDIPSIRADLFGILKSRRDTSVDDGSESGDRSRPAAETPATLMEMVMAYAADPDVVRLAAARRQYDDWEWTLLFDRRSGQAFLLVARNENSLPAIFRVSGQLVSEEQQQIEIGDLRSDTIDRFVGSRAAVLSFVIKDVR